MGTRLAANLYKFEARASLREADHSRFVATDGSLGARIRLATKHGLVELDRLGKILDLCKPQ